MTAPDERAAEIDEIVTMLDSVGSEYLDWKGQLFPIATKVYEWKQECLATHARRLEEARAALEHVRRSAHGFYPEACDGCSDLEKALASLSPPTPRRATQ